MITIKSFEVNYFSENTYLLYDDTKEAVLIDCGCLRKEEQKEVKSSGFSKELPIWSLETAKLRMKNKLEK